MKDTRVVCLGCLKPTCNTCFDSCENKVCGNCRGRDFLDKDSQEFIFLFKDTLSRSCRLARSKHSKYATECSSNYYAWPTFDCDGFVLCCENHSFICGSCSAPNKDVFHEIRKAWACKCGKLTCMRYHCH